MLASWADAGAPEGNPKDKPAALTFQAGWNIKPDMVIEVPERFQCTGRTGTINYQKPFWSKANFSRRYLGSLRRRCVQAIPPWSTMNGSMFVRPDRNGWRTPSRVFEYEGTDPVMGKNSEGGEPFLANTTPASARSTST